MTIANDIYDNVDDFGLITSAEARELGLGAQELVQQAARGKLVRVAHGVYRIPVWPFQQAAPYAIAVKAAGPGAYLCGESVVALLGLAPTSPGAMWVASPRRVRRNLGDGVRLLDRQPEGPTTYYEGVACQPLVQAIPLAARSIGPIRACQAAEEAVRQGYITEKERTMIAKELSS